MSAVFEKLTRPASKNREDTTGAVQIKITGMGVDGKDRWTPRKGNITRSVTVEKAKVSEVLREVEKALFF